MAQKEIMEKQSVDGKTIRMASARKQTHQSSRLLAVLACSIILLISLLGIASAAVGITEFSPLTDQLNSQNACQADSSNNMWDWVPMALLALTAWVFVLAIAYMLSMGLSIPRLTAWTKNELFQTFASALLIGLIVSSFVLMQSFSANVVPGGSLGAAKAYSVKMRNTLLSDFVVISAVNNFISSYASLNINLMPGRMGVQFQIGPALRPLLDALGLLMNSLIAGIGAWSGHELLLCFIERNMLNFFLPIGLFLRAIPFTRSAGAAFISLSLSFYFVYPLMINLNEQIVAPHYKNMWNPDVKSGFGFVGGVKSMLAGASTFVLMGGWFAYGFAMFFGVGFLTFNAVVTGLILFVIVPILIAAAKQVYFSILIVSIILPFFNIFVTLALAREIAKYMGTDINLSTLTQLL